MANLESAISVAAPWAFTLPSIVKDEDIDGLGHASNIAYVRWIQDVAIAHSTSCGFDLEAYRQLNGVFIVRRHEIDYLRPVLRGDRLTLRTRVDVVMAAKCKRATEIALEDAGTLVARSETTWGFIDFTTGRPTRIPEPIRAAFGFPRVVLAAE